MPFTVREMTIADVPAVAALHVATFNETHTTNNDGPRYELREHTRSTCCAATIVRGSVAHCCEVGNRFLGRGVSSMLLFGDANNPSNRFYEAMGGERIMGEGVEFQSAYGWRDLRKLAQRCAGDRR
jgi:hypothetical protein